MEQSKIEMAEKVSILYYERNLGQQAIAGKMGISRSYVSQLLALAKDLGIVKVTINIDESNKRKFNQELQIRDIFPELKSVFILQSDSDEYTASNLGRFSANMLTGLVQNADVIGVNLGKSVQNAVESLEPHAFQDNGRKTVVQIMGGFQTHQPNSLVYSLSEILQADCLYLNCPAICIDPNLKKTLMQEPMVKQVTELWSDIDLAIMGLGVVSESNPILKMYPKELLSVINKSKAVGEITASFFNADGQIIDGTEKYTIAISLDNILKIRNKVVIAAGANKIAALNAALKGRLIDTLITDSLTSQALIDLNNNPGR